MPRATVIEVVARSGGQLSTVYELRCAQPDDKYRRLVRSKGITPRIARRGVEHGSGLGVHRWVVEQSFALLHWFRRLRIRWEIRDDISIPDLACGIICWRRLVNLALR